MPQLNSQELLQLILSDPSRAQRRDLQRKLAARGYDVGEPDGRVGQKTRDAIKEIERSVGMAPTGRPGGRVLEALR